MTLRSTAPTSFVPHVSTAEASSRACSTPDQHERVEREVERMLVELMTEVGAVEAVVRERGEASPSLAARIPASFVQFSAALNELIGDHADIPAQLRERLGARVHDSLQPYVLMTETVERMYTKPCGYAGDYLSIDAVYNEVCGGEAPLGPIFDRCVLDLPAAKAVRNRRDLLRAKIEATLAAHPDRPVEITTLACGPAREVFDVFETLEDPTRLFVNLVDIDANALAQVREEAAQRGLSAQIRLIEANLIRVALGRDSLPLAEQDLVYSIGLIDYFRDRVVVALMSAVYELLRPGGQLILGNFDVHNPDKAVMDHVLDWRLIHRSEADMDRLFTASAFGRGASAIDFEAEGVNLFATCERSSGPLQAAK